MIHNAELNFTESKRNAEVMRKNYVNVKNHRKNKGLSIRGVTLDDVIFIIISLN